MDSWGRGAKWGKKNRGGKSRTSQEDRGKGNVSTAPKRRLNEGREQDRHVYIKIGGLQLKRGRHYTDFTKEKKGGGVGKRKHSHHSGRRAKGLKKKKGRERT